MSSSSHQRRLIIEYWFRVILYNDISIANISKIALDFGAEYETFDRALSYKGILIENGTLAFKEGKGWGDWSVFGIIVATAGNMYHWKIKLSAPLERENAYISLNIGIIEADKCEQYQKLSWWTEVGISYFSSCGSIFLYDEVTKECKYHEYGKGFEEEDEIIMDIWLDIKDKYELSFAKNDENYGKATDVKKSMEYRLAVSICDPATKAELLSFDIQ